MKKSKLIPALFGIILVSTLIVVGLMVEREPTPIEFPTKLGVSIISPPIPLPNVELINHENQPFGPNDLKGKWNLLFFGYTHCPDVCPTTMANLNSAAKLLPDDKLRYVFVSLDPQRDTPKILKDYLQYFNDKFIGVTGDAAQIALLTEALGVIYDFEGDTASQSYNVNHYAAVLVVDPKARLRAHILPPHPQTKMVDTINKIMAYYGD